MEKINNTIVNSIQRPIKILQFGEGNFLRAFVDWMIQKANAKNEFNAGVAVVQPLPHGMVDKLKQQDNMYHVILEGFKNGQAIRESELIDCIQDAINPYTDYETYKATYLKPELEFVISNTTEAGIVRVENEDIHLSPPASFPGKVCQLLYQRYIFFNGAHDKGLTFFCCELIDKNASLLKEVVLELAQTNTLESDFIDWINNSCCFCNTLVDRIVTGFPKDSISEIQREVGYKDSLVVVGEYFHLWAIEAPPVVRLKFPLDKANLNVVWLDDMTEFREKKVRILNGSHTALVAVGLLSGYSTVRDAFNDTRLANYIIRMLNAEIIPNISGDENDLKQFSKEILERFYNPYINHYLADISLNSLSKWMARNYPSLSDYHKYRCEVPDRLCFSLAALLVLYRGEYNGLSFDIKDKYEHKDFISNEWKRGKDIQLIVGNILRNSSIWGLNLCKISGLSAKVALHVNTILQEGINKALDNLN